MCGPNSETDQASVFSIDALARATRTWVQQRILLQACAGIELSDAVVYQLAAGFISGVTQIAAFGARDVQWVAHAYSLLDIRGRGSLHAMNEILLAQSATVHDEDYQCGYLAARDYAGHAVRHIVPGSGLPSAARIN
ncbi:MAG: hypothetical protein ACR2P6_07700 [Gammaproteobacteria bacterium]